MIIRTLKEFALYNRILPFHAFRKTSYVLSYRKCGRTWFATVLMHYIAYLKGSVREPLEFSNSPMKTYREYFSLGYDVIFMHDFFAPKSPLALKIKTTFVNPLDNSPCVFLVRDPRDVVISHYYHLTGRRERKLERGRDLPPETIDECVLDKDFGIGSVVEFLNKQAQYAKESALVRFVRYEDLKKSNPDYKQIWKETFEFLLGVSIDQDALDWALEVNDFSNMKKREAKSRKTRSKIADKKVNNSRVRSGKSGSYIDELKPETIAALNEYIDENLDDVFNDYKTQTARASAQAH